MADDPSIAQHALARSWPAPRAGLLAALFCVVLACSLLSASSPASAATSISSNWAGYVAVSSASADSRFSSASASWMQPTASCAGAASYSAVWTGLGGYHEDASSLEQIGTDADCSRTGHARDSSWYELVPAGPVTIGVKVHPGDRMTASVTVRGHHVTLRLRDLTTGARFSTTLHASNTDVSSADWIVEAPSVCRGSGSCTALPLNDFGTVLFSGATATARGHTGTIDDGAWATTALELQQASALAASPATVSSGVLTPTATTATPSSTSSDGSFSVTWAQQTTQIERTAPTLPGFGGGTKS